MRRVEHALGIDTGSQWELDVTNVAHGDRIRPTWSLYGGAKGLGATVLDVNTHFERCIVGPIPHLNVGIERASACAKSNLYLLHPWGTKRPRTKGSSLDRNGIFGVRVVVHAWRWGAKCRCGQ
mgnify:CR=1 FL=1